MAEQAAVRQLLTAIPAGSSILLPPTCGTPAGLDAALAEQSERLAGSRVRSGLLLGNYPFLEQPHLGRLHYGTWHVPRVIGHLADAGLIDAYPIRASDVPRFIRRSEADQVVIAQVSPPDTDGWCSLGVSGSYVLPAARSASTLIVHVNPQMPRVPGPCRIKLSDATVAINHDQPLLEHPATSPDDISVRIAGHIEPLVPDGATLQIGFGSVPEAVLDTLRRSGRQDLAVWSMATDGVVSLDEAGMLHSDPSRPAVVTHDVLGTRRVFDWLHDNDRVRLHDYDVCTSVAEIGQLPRFVSINSAVEVDLQGNANTETVGGRTVSGVGGGPDFADGARRSEGGVSILAFPSTARGGTISRIVPRLDGVPYSLPRTSVQQMITEHGAVDLSTMSIEQRADALIGLADPRFQDGLWTAHADARSSGRGHRDVPGEAVQP